MRILVVEDEPKIANSIKRGLEQQSYAVDVATDGDEGLANATSIDYDLLILDRMLPGSIDGVGILKSVRESGKNVPVLFLTAKDRVIDKAYGLNEGADDYLVKPFAFVELVARVRALLRRKNTDSVGGNGSVLTYKDLGLDFDRRCAVRGGKTISLSAKEFALLEYLFHNPERVISKDELCEHVWDFDADILPNTIEVYIGYLRRKIDKDFPKLPSLINTKRGFGYIFGGAA